MLTSNAAPMLGTLTPNRCGRRFRREDKPVNARWRQLEIREARQAERDLLDFDLDYPDVFEQDFEQAREAIEAESKWLQASETAEDEPAGCSCRRCRLHKDFGGCLCSDDLGLLWGACGSCRKRFDEALDAFDDFSDAPDFDEPHPYAIDELDAEDFWAARDLDELPGSPGWGETRVDYSEFVSGFHIVNVFAATPRTNRVRIWQLARSLDMSALDVLDVCWTLQIPVRSHTSTLAPSEAALVAHHA